MVVGRKLCMHSEDFNARSGGGNAFGLTSRTNVSVRPCVLNWRFNRQSDHAQMRLDTGE